MQRWFYPNNIQIAVEKINKLKENRKKEERYKQTILLLQIIKQEIVVNNKLKPIVLAICLPKDNSVGNCAVNWNFQPLGRESAVNNFLPYIAIRM